MNSVKACLYRRALKIRSMWQGHMWTPNEDSENGHHAEQLLPALLAVKVLNLKTDVAVN